ncbi:glycosyltransferase family 4 protein [Pelosinus sp. sgz500959]|uniref:glycosyltransferase family 4 protein n=1 Tax=Pelosinus sp. sgz500959 TaxID=3242472 RepID=UPI00366C91D7
MNILILFSQPWRVGGAETHVTDLIKGLTAKGHNVYLAVHGEKSKKMDELVKEQWSFNFRSANPFQYVIVSKELAKLIKDKKIDIIHSHQRTAGYLASYIKRMIGIPFVVTIHDPWNRAVFKSYYGKIFDHIITVSEFLKKRFIADFGFSPDKVHTIYNGADSERYNVDKYPKDQLNQLREGFGIKANEQVVSLIARLYESKGQQYLIAATKAVAQKCPNVKILLVGSGEHEERFRKQVAEDGLDKFVIFTGYREDIPELIAISDIVVRPSDMEGFPINMLEAMLMRKPVIATNIAGVPEMITHGENGFMIEPGDVDQLANYISTILLDEELGKKMGTRGEQIVLEKFTLKSLIAKVENLYASLV